MTPRATVYVAASAFMFLSVAKRAAYAGLLLLALPLDVGSVASGHGTAVSHHFCDRNPHTCASVSELYQELQLRSIAVQGLASSLTRHLVAQGASVQVVKSVQSQSIRVGGPMSAKQSTTAMPTG